MTEKELRRLSRADLLELLAAQMRENDRLKAELEEAREQLRSRNIEIEAAGSIAEASLALNGVFEAAQAAADQYLDNIRRLQLKTRREYQAARYTALKNESDSQSGGEAHRQEDRSL